MTRSGWHAYDLVVVGASAGGVTAVKYLLGALGPGFGAPIVVVLHLAEGRESHLAEALSGPLPVREAVDKEPLVPGQVIVGPPGYHLLIGDRTCCALSIDPPVHFCRPAVDALFESAADVFHDRVVGVLLTGANEDGAAGARAIEQLGGVVWIQDPATAEARAMPEAGIAACAAARVGTLDEIAGWLLGGAR